MNTHYQVHGKALELANAFGFLFPAEVALIYVIARSLPESAVCVNIGAGTGTGSLALVEMRPDLKAYTVDISEGGPLGGLENERNAFQAAGIRPLPTQVLGDSKAVCKTWSEDIDYLFIDGDHSEEGLGGDMDGWLPFVRSGGYVLFHDYGSNDWAAVRRLVDERMVRPRWKRIFEVDTMIAFQRMGAK